ncbi:unnamed protein product [Caenorhabditis bovis]|uniref:ADP-ribosylation factor-like protein 13B n=1 Tax=Caenorhabditis bovis TaxID=2654633 RepID=A0A8S1F5U7_9PELO|nr:unnamed protein product [Caenorhabditis bovis]
MPTSWLETIFCCRCCCRNEKIVQRTVTLGCFGIDGAGKSTILKMLKGEDPRNVLTTNGFSVFEMDYDERFRLRIYDVGGDKGIRDIWSNYFGEVYGIIYVIDYSNEETYQESIEAFQRVTNHPQCSKKPILLIINNKNNLEIDDVDISNAANIQTTSSVQQQMVMITHLNRYNGYLDNIKTSNMSVFQRAKKDRSALQDQFCAFMSLIAEHYVYLTEGVRSAELALQIRQQADKENRRIMLMQEEHELRKADIAGLEGRRSTVVTEQPRPAENEEDEKELNTSSPAISLASSTIPSDIVQVSPDDTPPPKPVKVSQTSTKPVSPDSNSGEQKNTDEIVSETKRHHSQELYFLPPKSPGRHTSRIQRIQSALNSRVAPL